MTSPVIDSKRLWRSLEEFSAYGATAQRGLDRLALGEQDGAARDHLVAEARERGYAVAVDPIGNVFLTRAGRRADLPPVLLGSHLDSVPRGGRFDGSYGVIAGLEVLRALDDAGAATLRPIVLADWTNEEGARFSPSMLGSAVHAGRYALDHALARTDAEGVRLGEALEAIGYAGTGAGPERVHRSLELHIEQGPVLEERGLDIGVVTGIYGIHWLDVTVRGRSGHAGTTPTASRQDALLAAAHVILAVRDLAQDAELRATAGEIRVVPNSRNAIPGDVMLAIDLRHPDAGHLAAAEAALRRRAGEIARDTGTVIEVENVLAEPPTRFDPGTIELIREVTAARGYAATEIVSGAGHDSLPLAAVARAGMIFIPCIGGVSHREDEDIRPEWATNGADVLLHATLRAANET